MRADFLRFAIPEIGEEEIAEMIDSIRSGWLTELPPKNWTGGEGALRPTFLSEEVWYNARHETSA